MPSSTTHKTTRDYALALTDSTSARQLEKPQFLHAAGIAVGDRLACEVCLEDAWMLLIKDEAFRYVPAFLGDALEDRTRASAGPEHRELRARVSQAASSIAGTGPVGLSPGRSRQQGRVPT